MLKLRLLTVGLLLPIVIWVVYFGSMRLFGWLALLLMFLGTLEWAKLMDIKHVLIKIVYALLIALLIFDSGMFPAKPQHANQ